MFVILLLLFGAGSWSRTIDAGKVLGVFEYTDLSHFLMFEALMKELASRGHQVTVISHFPQKMPIANYTDISISGSVPLMTDSFSPELMKRISKLTILNFFWSDCFEKCLKIMEHPNMKKMINSTESYDLVVLEIIGGADCGYIFGHKFQAPVVGMTSFARIWNIQFRMGYLENPAIVPFLLSSYSTEMRFWQRLDNTFWTFFSIVGERLVAHPKINSLLYKLFGDSSPTLEQLQFNTSLILLNSHFSLNGVLPDLPGVVEVGGMHISPNRKKLPKDFKQWLDGAGEAGAVYVSFGSLARVEEMPLRQLEAIEQTLGALAQRVVWKCDGAKMAQRLGRPLHKNILSATWTPQADILAHPNVRAFVSHAGLMGVQEAVFWGKPMVLVPLFVDQDQNANNLIRKGMAIQLDFEEITELSLNKALNSVIYDPSYAENARHLSTLFRDRPRTAMQEAVAWTEYVMRHRGASHLRSGGVHLRWWQHCLLDVIAIAIFAVIIILWTILFLIRSLHRYLRRLLLPKVKSS